MRRGRKWRAACRAWREREREREMMLNPLEDVIDCHPGPEDRGWQSALLLLLLLLLLPVTALPHHGG